MAASTNSSKAPPLSVTGKKMSILKVVNQRMKRKKKGREAEKKTGRNTLEKRTSSTPTIAKYIERFRSSPPTKKESRPAIGKMWWKSSSSNEDATSASKERPAESKNAKDKKFLEESDVPQAEDLVRIDTLVTSREIQQEEALSPRSSISDVSIETSTTSSSFFNRAGFGPRKTQRSAGQKAYSPKHPSLRDSPRRRLTRKPLTHTARTRFHGDEVTDGLEYQSPSGELIDSDNALQPRRSDYRLVVEMARTDPEIVALDEKARVILQEADSLLQSSPPVFNGEARLKSKPPLINPLEGLETRNNRKAPETAEEHAENMLRLLAELDPASETKDTVEDLLEDWRSRRRIESPLYTSALALTELVSNAASVGLALSDSTGEIKSSANSSKKIDQGKSTGEDQPKTGELRAQNPGDGEEDEEIEWTVESCESSQGNLEELFGLVPSRDTSRDREIKRAIDDHLPVESSSKAPTVQQRGQCDTISRTLEAESPQKNDKVTADDTPSGNVSLEENSSHKPLGASLELKAPDGIEVSEDQEDGQEDDQEDDQKKLLSKDPKSASLSGDKQDETKVAIDPKNTYFSGDEQGETKENTTNTNDERQSSAIRAEAEVAHEKKMVSNLVSAAETSGNEIQSTCENNLETDLRGPNTLEENLRVPNNAPTPFDSEESQPAQNEELQSQKFEDRCQPKSNSESSFVENVLEKKEIDKLNKKTQILSQSDVSPTTAGVETKEKEEHVNGAQVQNEASQADVIHATEDTHNTSSRPHSPSKSNAATPAQHEKDNSKDRNLIYDQEQEDFEFDNPHEMQKAGDINSPSNTTFGRLLQVARGAAGATVMSLPTPSCIAAETERNCGKGSGKSQHFQRLRNMVRQIVESKCPVTNRETKIQARTHTMVFPMIQRNVGFRYVSGQRLADFRTTTQQASLDAVEISLVQDSQMRKMLFRLANIEDQIQDILRAKQAANHVSQMGGN